MSTQVVALRYKDNSSPDIWGITHCQLASGESIPVEEVLERLDEGESFFMIDPVSGTFFPIKPAVLVSHVPEDGDPARILQRTITAGTKDSRQ